MVVRLPGFRRLFSRLFSSALPIFTCALLGEWWPLQIAEMGINHLFPVLNARNGVFARRSRWWTTRHLLIIHFVLTYLIRHIQETVIVNVFTFLAILENSLVLGHLSLIHRNKFRTLHQSSELHKTHFTVLDLLRHNVRWNPTLQWRQGSTIAWRGILHEYPYDHFIHITIIQSLSQLFYSLRILLFNTKSPKFVLDWFSWYAAISFEWAATSSSRGTPGSLGRRSRWQ